MHKYPIRARIHTAVIVTRRNKSCKQSIVTERLIWTDVSFVKKVILANAYIGLCKKKKIIKINCFDFSKFNV